MLSFSSSDKERFVILMKLNLYVLNAAEAFVSVDAAELALKAKVEEVKGIARSEVHSNLKQQEI